MRWIYYLGYLGGLSLLAIGITYLLKADDWATRTVETKQLVGFEANNAVKEESQRFTKLGLRALGLGCITLFLCWL